MFIRSATGAAARELPIYHDRRQTPDAQLLGSGCGIAMLHFVYTNLMIRSCDFLDQIDCFPTCRTSRAVDLDRVLRCCHGFPSLLQLEEPASQAGQMLRLGIAFQMDVAISSATPK